MLGFTLDLIHVLDYTGLISIYNYNSSIGTTTNEVEKDLFCKEAGRDGEGFGGDKW